MLHHLIEFALEFLELPNFQTFPVQDYEFLYHESLYQVGIIISVR